MLNVWIDDLTPCLKDNETGDFVQTEVIRIRRKSFLLKRMEGILIGPSCCRSMRYTQNNKLLCDNPKYSGVGGHLFAIAADKSVEYGFGGTIVGYAANMDLVNHYCSVFKAEHIAMLHPDAIYEEEAAELREVYDYEWTDEEI